MSAALAVQQPTKFELAVGLKPACNNKAAQDPGQLHVSLGRRRMGAQPPARGEHL